jgi:SAM-dependent methyltransferase
VSTDARPHPNPPWDVYTDRAALYAQFRLEYAPELVAEVAKITGLKPHHAVADMGSGTGKLAKHFLDRAARVYCVEPNQAMLAEARARLGVHPAFTAVPARAEASGLPDGSVHLITAGMSLDWFEPEAALVEFRRIACQQSSCSRDSTDASTDTGDCSRKDRSHNYTGIAGGSRTGVAAGSQTGLPAGGCTSLPASSCTGLTGDSCTGLQIGWLAIFRYHIDRSFYQQLSSYLSSIPMPSKITRPGINDPSAYLAPGYLTLEYQCTCEETWEQFIGGALSMASAPSVGSPEYDAFCSAHRRAFLDLSIDGRICFEYTCTAAVGHLRQS